MSRKVVRRFFIAFVLAVVALTLALVAGQAAGGIPETHPLRVLLNFFPVVTRDGGRVPQVAPGAAAATPSPTVDPANPFNPPTPTYPAQPGECFLAPWKAGTCTPVPPPPTATPLPTFTPWPTDSNTATPWPYPGPVGE